MSGYSVTEKRIERKGRPKTSLCGSCGAETEAKADLFCSDCLQDLKRQVAAEEQFFAEEAWQVENE